MAVHAPRRGPGSPAQQAQAEALGGSGPETRTSESQGAHTGLVG